MDGLDFGHELVGEGVGGFQLPPPVDVHWVLQLFGEGLHFELGVGILSGKVVYLVLEVGNRVSLLPVGLYLVDQCGYFLLLGGDVCQSLPVLGLSLAERRLVYFDLLVEQLSLGAPPNQLRPQDISLSHHQLILLLEFLLLRLRLLDDGVQLLDF